MVGTGELNIEKSKRSHILVDDEDIAKYKEVEKKLPFKNHLHTFAVATFIGYYEICDYKKINKPNNGFIHLSVFANSIYLHFLKSLAISHFNDPIILEDEKQMYTFCEEYARVGIEKMYGWCSKDEISDDEEIDEYDDDINFANKLAELMLDKFNELNVD